MLITYIWNRLLKKIRCSAIRNSTIHKSSKVESGSTVINSSFDRYTYCGYNCKILNCDIGAFTSIADNVNIGSPMHPIDWVGTSPVFYKGRDSINKKFCNFNRPEDKKTIIGNDVWIGDYAQIKAGIVVGDGAVIGMGSIVTKDVAPYEVVAGVPAKNIKFRFSPDIIERLLKLQWWNLTDEELAKHSSNIKNVEKFLEGFEK